MAENPRFYARRPTVARVLQLLDLRAGHVECRMAEDKDRRNVSLRYIVEVFYFYGDRKGVGT
jgi:hypothetical protein